MKRRKRNNIGRMALGVIRKFVPGVKRVSDANGDLYVTVTDKDFRAGKKKDHAECALAVAAKRQEHASHVIVSASTAYVVKDNHAVRYRLPESARKEVVSFDRGSQFAPGDYVMKAVPKSGRLGLYRGKRTVEERPKTGTFVKRFTHQTADIRDNLKAR